MDLARTPICTEALTHIMSMTMVIIAVAGIVLIGPMLMVIMGRRGSRLRDPDGPHRWGPVAVTDTHLQAYH